MTKNEARAIRGWRRVERCLCGYAPDTFTNILDGKLQVFLRCERCTRTSRPDTSTVVALRNWNQEIKEMVKGLSNEQQTNETIH